MSPSSKFCGETNGAGTCISVLAGNSSNFWSKKWGGSDQLWEGSPVKGVLPNIQGFLSIPPGRLAICKHEPTRGRTEKCGLCCRRQGRWAVLQCMALLPVRERTPLHQTRVRVGGGAPPPSPAPSPPRGPGTLPGMVGEEHPLLLLLKMLNASRDFPVKEMAWLEEEAVPVPVPPLMGASVLPGHQACSPLWHAPPALTYRPRPSSALNCIALYIHGRGHSFTGFCDTAKMKGLDR